MRIVLLVLTFILATVAGSHAGNDCTSATPISTSLTATIENTDPNDRDDDWYLIAVPAGQRAIVTITPDSDLWIDYGVIRTCGNWFTFDTTVGLGGRVVLNLPAQELEDAGFDENPRRFRLYVAGEIWGSTTPPNLEPDIVGTRSYTINVQYQNQDAPWCLLQSSSLVYAPGELIQVRAEGCIHRPQSLDPRDLMVFGLLEVGGTFYNLPGFTEGPQPFAAPLSPRTPCLTPVLAEFPAPAFPFPDLTFYGAFYDPGDNVFSNIDQMTLRIINP